VSKWVKVLFCNPSPNFLSRSELFIQWCTRCIIFGCFVYEALVGDCPSLDWIEKSTNPVQTACSGFWPESRHVRRGNGEGALFDRWVIGAGSASSRCIVMNDHGGIHRHFSKSSTNRGFRKVVTVKYLMNYRYI